MATGAFQKDHETVGLAIPIYFDMLNKTTIDPKINPDAGLILSCAPVAKALRESLVKRMSFVVKDSFYILGKNIHVSFEYLNSINKNYIFKDHF